MSFLLETEEQATLAEALAFIYTFARELQVDSSGAPSASTDSDPDSSLYVELRIPQLTDNNSNSSKSKTTESSGNSGTDNVGHRQQKKLLKGRAANTRAVNRYRKRTKTEILELRTKIGQLNMQLAELHKRNVAGTTGGTEDTGPAAISSSKECTALQSAQTDPAVGFEDVLVEYRKLQNSEALNHQLKDVLAKQRRITSMLKSVLQSAVSTKVRLTHFSLGLLVRSDN